MRKKVVGGSAAATCSTSRAGRHIHPEKRYKPGGGQSWPPVPPPVKPSKGGGGKGPSVQDAAPSPSKTETGAFLMGLSWCCFFITYDS